MREKKLDTMYPSNLSTNLRVCWLVIDRPMYRYVKTHRPTHTDHTEKAYTLVHTHYDYMGHSGHAFRSCSVLNRAANTSVVYVHAPA